jgi:hypothetical protein
MGYSTAFYGMISRLTGITESQIGVAPQYFAIATPTPLPATLPLFAGGLGFVGYLTHRRKRTGRKLWLLRSGNCKSKFGETAERRSLFFERAKQWSMSTAPTNPGAA